MSSVPAWLPPPGAGLPGFLRSSARRCAPRASRDFRDGPHCASGTLLAPRNVLPGETVRLADRRRRARSAPGQRCANRPHRPAPPEDDEPGRGGTRCTASRFAVSALHPASAAWPAAHFARGRRQKTRNSLTGLKFPFGPGLAGTLMRFPKAGRPDGNPAWKPAERPGSAWARRRRKIAATRLPAGRLRRSGGPKGAAGCEATAPGGSTHAVADPGIRRDDSEEASGTAHPLPQTGAPWGHAVLCSFSCSCSM